MIISETTVGELRLLFESINGMYSVALKWEERKLTISRASDSAIVIANYKDAVEFFLAMEVY